MQLISVKILKNRVPSNREYTYKASSDIKVDDIVTVPAGKAMATGVVAAVGIDEADVIYPIENIKEIVGIKSEEREDAE